MNQSLDKLGAYSRVSDIIETGNAFLFDVQGPDVKKYWQKVFSDYQFDLNPLNF